MCGGRRRAGSVRALLLFLVTCILIVWLNAGSVHVMRHLADSRYSNLCDGVISRIQLCGRCLKELECLRHFQIWHCLYKARSCIQIKGENYQTSENIGECQRASEGRRNVCSLRAYVINRVFLNHLEFVVCSSTTLWRRSTVGLCETPRTVIAVIRSTIHCCERYSGIFRIFGIFGRLDSTSQREKTSVLLGHRRVI